MFDSEKKSPNLEVDLTQHKVNTLWQFNEGLARSILIIRWIGYGLLVFFVFDLIETLVPPDFTNPVWELQAMGSVIERIVVPLLGLIFVFLGELNLRAKWELPTLKALSWLALLFGLLLFLLIPLGISNTVRIGREKNNLITNQLDQLMTQIQDAKKQLKQATTKDEMESLVSRLDTQGRAPNIQNNKQFGEIKKAVSGFVDQAELTAKTQASTALKNQRIALLRKSVKWNLGALVSGVLFIMIWQGTRRSRS